MQSFDRLRRACYHFICSRVASFLLRLETIWLLLRVYVRRFEASCKNGKNEFSITIHLSLVLSRRRFFLFFFFFKRRTWDDREWNYKRSRASCSRQTGLLVKQLPTKPRTKHARNERQAQDPEDKRPVAWRSNQISVIAREERTEL